MDIKRTVSGLQAHSRSSRNGRGGRAFRQPNVTKVCKGMDHCGKNDVGMNVQKRSEVSSSMSLSHK